MICVFSSVASGIGGMEVFIVLFAQDVGLVLCSLPLGNGRTECILPIGWLVKSLFHLVLLTAGVISRLIL